MRDGAAFVARTPLVRGLVIGIIGAFTAGGIVIGSATLYAASLGGGNAAYGVLFAPVFIGLALGMGAAPRMARRMPHNRLFGAAIVAAGLRAGAGRARAAPVPRHRRGDAGRRVRRASRSSPASRSSAPRSPTRSAAGSSRSSSRSCG